mmetsp:Transcript_18679/g.28990  ORF Transcript_18679/g.28990 Transcript_18679/m.28990 type:complete len:240 (-) Transcript_18679:590-1309(-)
MPRMKKPLDEWRKITSIVNQLYKKKSEYISETRRKAIHAKKKRIFDKRKSIVATLGNSNIMTLQREAKIQDELKQYCWMAGASQKLGQSKAQVLRNMIDNFQCMLSAAVVDVIFDKGASKSLTPFQSDFVGKIISCHIQLKGNWVWFDSGWKRNFNAANLPVANILITEDNGISQSEDNLDSLLCGSDENINLTRSQRHLLMWHHRIGHASFRLIRWLGHKKYLIGGEVDQNSTILCDS